MFNTVLSRLLTSLSLIITAQFSFKLYGQNEILFCDADKEGISYKIEMEGSVATASKTPFWIVSNQFGKTPLKSGNGYLDAGIFLKQRFGKSFYWRAGVNLVASVPRFRSIYLHQLYADFGYKIIEVSIGSKEQNLSLWNTNISSGDLFSSTNARPIPEIAIKIPEYQPLPFTFGWIQMKAYFSVGKSFDKDYLLYFTRSQETYIENTLWHRKNGHIRIKDTRNGFPISIEFGFRDVAQWGGTSTNPKFGKQPSSFKDFLRIVSGKSGGENATVSDQLNALGNHESGYDFRLGMELPKWQLYAYHQHIASDKSGLRFQNRTDGLWGIELNIKNFKPIQGIVIEHFTTIHQSGSFHMPGNSDTTRPGCPTGSDNYYNNSEYVTGISYFNRGLGSPIIPSPEYNKKGKLGFLNNRIKAYHVGIIGAASTNLSYRIMFTSKNSWGRANQPFLNNKKGTSTVIDLTYTHKRLLGWSFSGSFGFDTGDILGKTFGGVLKIRKTGSILKAKSQQ